MALNKIEQILFDRLKKEFGEMSEEQAINKAIEIEEHIKGMDDVNNRVEFYQVQIDFEKYALLIEKQKHETK